MAYDLDDTIAAIATAPGGAARGIVRISGSGALAAAAASFQADNQRPLGNVRHATALQGRLSLDDFAEPVPTTFYLWPTRISYTREPVVELHIPGSPPLVEAVLESVCRTGVRPAEPGEFTLRAFLAGRLDLTRAEAVLGVIDADNGGQLAHALEQLAGGIAGPVSAARDTLVNLLAELEAGLDFVEEDIEFITTDELQAKLSHALVAVTDSADQMTARSESDDLVRVALVGPVNAGKSSLFNALAAYSEVPKASALVSNQPGTTRDYLTVRLEVDGIVCELVDTAGHNCSDDAIDAAARQLTDRASETATIQLACVDLATIQSSTSDAEVRRYVNASAGTSTVLIAVGTKSDVAAETDRCAFQDTYPDAVVTSSRTGEGIDALRQVIHRAITSRPSHTAVTGTAVRCRESLRLAAASLGRAMKLAADTQGEELIAAEVRVALAELGKVVGKIYTDDILDRIFSRFCIGK